MSRGWNEAEFQDAGSKKFVNVNVNGDFDHGKNMHIELGWSIDDFLNFASQRLDLTTTAKRVFSADGVEVDDCMMFEDNEILFMSFGDAFIPPLDNTGLDGSGPGSRSGDNAAMPNAVGGFKVTDFLGRGGFGEVRLGEHQVTGERVALKFLRKSHIMTIGAAERTTTEIQCLTTLKHPGIIRLHSHVESPNHFVLVFELMEGGDLYNFLMAKGRETGNYSLEENQARDLFGQIMSAVSYAHNQHICHRDLKLENILLKTKEGVSCVKIADFGLSDFYRPGAMVKSSCGTLSFLAPEVFRGTSNAGPPLDVWSLGVILFAVMCGRLPFEGPDLRNPAKPREAVIRARIMKCQYKLDDRLGGEVKDLIRRMLMLDPTERATIPEVCGHIWLRSMNFPLARSPTNSEKRGLSGLARAASEMDVVGESTQDKERRALQKAEWRSESDVLEAKKTDAKSRSFGAADIEGLDSNSNLDISDLTVIVEEKGSDNSSQPTSSSSSASAAAPSSSAAAATADAKDSITLTATPTKNENIVDSFKLRPLRRMASKHDLNDDAAPLVQSSASAAAAAAAAGSARAEAKGSGKWSGKGSGTDADAGSKNTSASAGADANPRRRPSMSAPIPNVSGSPSSSRRKTVAPAPPRNAGAK